MENTMIEHSVYKFYTDKEKIKEIAAIAAIMAYETFDKVYDMISYSHGGATGIAFEYADWATEFFEKNLDTIWEEQEDNWDELALKFAFKKAHEAHDIYRATQLESYKKRD